MKDWITKLIIEQLLKQLTKEKIEEWVDAGKAALKPMAYTAKDAVVAAATKAAADTTNTIDDELVKKMDDVLTALLNEFFA